MNSVILNKVETKFIKSDIPPFAPGDTIAVHTVIREGDKQRSQIFRGIVIAIKGSGTRKTFTVRKISFGVGVEKIFPLHSPNISKITLLKKGKVRRAKLYYMRARIGKKAMKIKAGKLSEKDQKRFEELEKLGVIEGEDQTEEIIDTQEVIDTTDTKSETSDAKADDTKEKKQEDQKSEAK